MKKVHLTLAEFKVLRTWREMTKRNGVQPTVREMMDALGYQSPRAVHKQIQSMQEKRVLLGSDGKARTLKENPNIEAVCI